MLHSDVTNISFSFFDYLSPYFPPQLHNVTIADAKMSVLFLYEQNARINSFIIKIFSTNQKKYEQDYTFVLIDKTTY